MKFRTALLGGIGSILIVTIAAQAQVPGVNSTLATVFTLAYDNSTSKPTYSASAIVAPGSAANDTCVLIGSATKTLRVRRVILSGISATVQSDPVAIVKRSTVATDGTGSKPTIVSYNSQNSSATGVVETFTVSPTNGTAVGKLADVYMQWANLTTGVAAPIEFKFGELGSPVFLRGTSQSIAVNLGGLTYLSGSLSCTFEWTEDSDS